MSQNYVTSQTDCPEAIFQKSKIFDMPKMAKNSYFGHKKLRLILLAKIRAKRTSPSFSEAFLLSICKKSAMLHFFFFELLRTLASDRLIKPIHLKISHWPIRVVGVQTCQILSLHDHREYKSIQRNVLKKTKFFPLFSCVQTMSTMPSGWSIGLFIGWMDAFLGITPAAKGILVIGWRNEQWGP